MTKERIYTEREIEKYLTDRCKILGIETRKVKWVGHDAAPDRFLFVNGGVFVECKRPGESPRSNQELEFSRMSKAGCLVYVADSKERVDYILNAIKEES